MKKNDSNHCDDCFRGLGLIAVLRFWLAPKLVVAGLALVTVSAQAADITWGQTNTTSSFNWSEGANWVGGVVPTAADNAVYVSTNAINPTIVVDLSTNLQDLSITRAAIAGTAGAADTTGITLNIAAGKTLSVFGPNGLVVQHASASGTNGIKMKCIYNFTGETLLVSNSVASFVLNSGVSFNQSGTWDTYNMSGLTNLTVKVNMFGIANSKLAGGVVVGDQGVQITSPKTNIVTALRADDYTQLDFTNSVEISRMDNAPNTSYAQNAMYQLGSSNAFYCDSFGIGRGNSAGNTANMSMSALTAATPNGKNSAGFNVSFASVNSATPTSSVFFRNTNRVDRMSLLAIGVDSGAGLTNSRNNGILNLRGGKVDMRVDQIWLGQNRTNALGNSDMGGFAFDNGTVDANKVIAGYMKYTNSAFCGGYLLVGTNGTMRINDYLELGRTPVDPLGDFAGFTAQTRGQVQVDNGGKLYVKQVNLGGLSTNNSITINSGGLVVVSNTIADANKSLTALNIAGGTMAFFVSAGVTNACVTNLTVSGTPTIQIASISGFSSYPATNVLIAYQAVHASPQTYAIITPTNFNNLQVIDDTVAQTINLIIKTNAPLTLTWRGGANANWDHTSLNWVDANTNTTFFSEGDTVTFDDKPGVPTTITLTENINPSQVGTGITVTNNLNNFTFNTTSTESIGGVGLVKSGTNGLAINCPSVAVVQVNHGSLTGSGTINSITVASGASMNFAGTIAATLVSAGSATVGSGGIVNGAVSVQAGGSLSNQGTINGTLSMSSGSTVLNTGLMTAIGSTTITTNSVLSNAGTIYGSTVTVAVGGTLIDTYAGSTGTGAGSINVVSLLVNGTFIPGGSTIQTTKVADYNYSSGALLTPNGRVNLNPGSTTIMRVNMNLAPGQTNTLLLSQNQGFGASAGFKSFTGGTLFITNVGSAPFAAGQSFKMFGNYYDGGDCLNTGLNSTNTYPVIVPATPGPGLVWELDQLIPQGVIRILSVNDPSRLFTLTNNTYVWNDSGTNRIVTQLTWPVDKMGGWVQQLNATLTNGLSATNWFSLNGNYGNTNAGIQIMSDTNVWFITNNLVADPNALGSATFFRFVYP